MTWKEVITNITLLIVLNIWLGVMPYPQASLDYNVLAGMVCFVLTLIRFVLHMEDLA